MATSHTIPSKLSGTGGETITATAASTTSWQSGGLPRKSQKLYITALLTDSDLDIDGVTVTSPGPVTLSSPIICTTFTTTDTGQVAYYEI